MNKLYLLILCFLFNGTVFAQLTEEQQRIYNNLSPAEKKKVDDKIRDAANGASNNMVIEAIKIRHEEVLKMKPLSHDSVIAIVRKVNKAGELKSYFDLLVYKNFGGNDNDRLNKFEAADSSFLYAKNALTKKDLSTATANIIFYYYKNLYDYAKSLFKRKKYQTSYDNFMEASGYYHRDSSHYYAAKSGIELLKQGVAVNRQSVLENLNKAVLLDAKSDLFIRERGYFYLSQLKDTSFGFADLTKAVQLNAKDPISYQLLSLIEFNRSNLKEAIRYINKSIEIDKNNDTYYFQRGLYYQFLEEYQLAISDFNSAIILNSFDPKFYIYRVEGQGLVDRWQACAAHEEPLPAVLITAIVQLHFNLVGAVRQLRGVQLLVADVIESRIEQLPVAANVDAAALVQEQVDRRSFRGVEIGARVERSADSCADDVPFAEECDAAAGASKAANFVLPARQIALLPRLLTPNHVLLRFEFLLKY